MPPTIASLCFALLAAALLAACSSGDQRDLGAATSPLDDTEWRLAELAGSAPDAERPVTIRFQSDGSVTGQSFVNQYFAGFTTDGNERLEIDQIGATRMAGPPELMSQEQTYFELLGSADAFRSDGASLTLLRAGDTVLRFERE